MRARVIFWILPIFSITLPGLWLTSRRGEMEMANSPTSQTTGFEWTVKAIPIPKGEKVVEVVSLKANDREISFADQKSLVVQAPGSLLEGVAVTMRNTSERVINQAKVELRFRESDSQRHSTVVHGAKGNAAQLVGVEPDTWIRPGELFEIPIIEPMASKLRSAATSARDAGVVRVTVEISVLQVVFDGLKDFIWRRDSWFRRDPANPRGFYRVDKITSLEGPDRILKKLVPVREDLGLTSSFSLGPKGTSLVRSELRANSAFSFVRAPARSTSGDRCLAIGYIYNRPCGWEEQCECTLEYDYLAYVEGIFSDAWDWDPCDCNLGPNFCFMFDDHFSPFRDVDCIPPP